MWSFKKNKDSIIKEKIIVVIFKPTEDITAKELADFISKLSFCYGRIGIEGIAFTQSKWDILDTNIKRHLIIKP